MVTRHPDIDAERLEIGAALLFGLDHRGILHSGVRHFANQVGPCLSRRCPGSTSILLSIGRCSLGDRRVRRR